MKFFVKDDKDTLIAATSEQVMSPDTVLYNESGDVLGEKATASDPIAELAGMVKDIAIAQAGESSIKTKVEEMEAQMALYKEAAQKGFPIPGMMVDKDIADDDVEALIAPYKLARQGKSLMNKRLHPGYTIEDDMRIEMAKYYCLFLKASVANDPWARMKMKDLYGDYKYADDVQKTNTIDIGDSGNLFPVPDIIEEEIIHFMREKSVIMQDARNWDMVSEKQTFPVEGSAVTIQWGNTTQEDTPLITEKELTAIELSAYAAVRNMTLADSRSDIVSWLTEIMAEGAGQALDEEGFNGDGSTVTSGLYSSAGATVTTASPTFASATADDYSEMIGELDGLRKESAKFYHNGAVQHFIRTLKDDGGALIFQALMSSPTPGTIWGYPYQEVIKSNGTSGASANMSLFGNLLYFMLGRRLDSTALSADPFGLWTTNRTRFKIYQRWGMVVALPAAFVKLVTASG